MSLKLLLTCVFVIFVGRTFQAGDYRFFRMYHTEANSSYKYFPVLNDNEFRFLVQSANKAKISLTNNTRNNAPKLELILTNHVSLLRINNVEETETSTPNILDSNQFTGFWITWFNGTFKIGKQDDPIPFMTYKENDVNKIFYIRYAGLSADTDMGLWVVKIQKSRSGTWFKASNGSLGCDSYTWPMGYLDGEEIYIARAYHKHHWVPGKLIPSQGATFIGWNGYEHKYREYEVLCNFFGIWIEAEAGNYPRSAFKAGEDDVGQPLFIGRYLFDMSKNPINFVRSFVNKGPGALLGRVTMNGFYVPYNRRDHAVMMQRFQIYTSDDKSNW